MNTNSTNTTLREKILKSLEKYLPLVAPYNTHIGMYIPNEKLDNAAKSFANGLDKSSVY